jgi:NAD dependent epimerase/dehydratase family enzyme
LIDNAEVNGAFNATAPEPVTNAQFARTLGRALQRPSFLPTPAIALRLLFGEMADLLLTGQRVLPQRALALGFQFRYPQLADALATIVHSR